MLQLDFAGAPLAGAPLAGDGLEANPCWPERLLQDPGFALLTDDPYYLAHLDASVYAHNNYPDQIPQNMLKGNSPQPGYRKRDSNQHTLDPDNWVYSDGNSSRPVTEEELNQVLGIERCSSGDCEKEMHKLGVETAVVVEPSEAASLGPKATRNAPAEPTPEATTTPGLEASAGSDAQRVHGMAQPTMM